MHLIITEVTEMHNDMRCVGAWDPEHSLVVRPLPNGNHWSAQLIEQHSIKPGSCISVAPAGDHHSEFPHRTEDTRVAANSIENTGNEFVDWFGDGAPECEQRLSDIFGGNLQLGNEFHGFYKSFVPAGANCRSLFGLEIDVGNIEFFQDQYQDNPPKLRARIYDSERGYDLPVSSLISRQTWREGGVAALRDNLPENDRVHLRIGLARPFDGQPNRCSMQLNGVLF